MTSLPQVSSHQHFILLYAELDKYMATLQGVYCVGLRIYLAIPSMRLSHCKVPLLYCTVRYKKWLRRIRPFPPILHD
jgi:hypothetical protein